MNPLLYRGLFPFNTCSRKKVHNFSFSLSIPSKNEAFFSRKIRPFETKSLFLRLIKHNFPFIPPHCGVHIAQSRGTFPDPPAQTLFDLLNPSRLRLIPAYRNRPQRRCPSQSGDICTTATHPLRLGRKEGGAKACFSSTRKGAFAFFGQRALGKPIRFLSCSRAANPAIIIYFLGGGCFLKKKARSPHLKGFGMDFSAVLKFTGQQ